MSSRSSSRGGQGSVQGVNTRVYNISGTTFKVDRRYRELKGIGRGSYGVVASASDVGTGGKVAIKKIKPMAAHTADAKHVLREVRLMRYLSAHPNIITMHDLFAETANDELYIVMELLDSDLHRIIQSPQPLTDAHHRYFMYQLLRGIAYLHDHNIIHRDLKPGNLLVTRNCDLRITGERSVAAAAQATIVSNHRPPPVLITAYHAHTPQILGSRGRSLVLSPTQFQIRTVRWMHRMRWRR
mmetsp:Transcript_41100/g.109652  ORF Transcript_41100/g.109652 Transcript_41100/m.109652 type:complete len:241 (+) Transcript_41100:121-843(+)